MICVKFLISLKFEYYLNKNVHETLKVAPLEYKYLGEKGFFGILLLCVV